MSLRPLLSVLLVAPLAACASEKMNMTPSTAMAKPAPQMAELDRFMGTWTGTAEIVSGKEAMMAMMKEMNPSFTGDMMPCKSETTFEWDLGGMFMRSEGWHEMMPGMTEGYVEYYAWDPTMKKYHNWYFSTSGETGDGWMTMMPDGKTFDMTWDSMMADGTTSKGGGKMMLTDPQTMTWTMYMDTDHGRVEMRGTSKKR
jgi:hypothetical protein